MSTSASPPNHPLRDTLAAQAAQLVAALRSEQAPAQPPAAAQSNAGTRVRILVATFAGILLLAAVWMITTGRWFRGSAPVPPELIGVWRTTVPSHADRPFEVTDSTLVIHTGGSDSTVHAITNVRSRSAGDGVEYTIEYRSDGEIFLWSFTLTDGSDPVVRFRNQPRLVWRKQQ